MTATETVETQNTTFEINGQQYEIGIKVKYDRRYRIECRLWRDNGWVGKTKVDSRMTFTENNSSVGGKVDEIVVWATKKAEARESARNLDISVEVTVDE